MTTASAAIDRLQRAIEAERAGRTAEARAIASALAQAELRDHRLQNSCGALLMRLDDAEGAADLFERAWRAAPGEAEYAMNRAIALTALGRGGEALAVLQAAEPQGGGLARYWSVRANAARQANALQEARRCYERALACDSSYGKARQGLAQVALERGEPDAVALFDEALMAEPGNPYLWRGKAEALEVVGDRAGAMTIARQITEQAPRWTEGLELLAQLRLAAGEADYTSHYAQAMRRHPDDPNIAAAWIGVLAGLDHYSRAAAVARDAAARFPQLAGFRLLEAVHAGNAGDDRRAETVFAELPLATAERFLHEARHRIRRGEFSAAEDLLVQVLEQDRWNISAWALRSLVWRARKDERHRWLHGQDALVRKLPLSADDGLLAEAIKRLRELHAMSALPLNQSLRGGTQTRGSLFARHEPVFQELQTAIARTVVAYQADLPPADATHPLLRQRDAELAFAGSWSVRLTGGGDHHTAHIHPQGILSSALYLVVPERDRSEGLLELGRPPPDLRLDLPPEHVIEPETGFLALFPSTLYHGTTPFGRSERMTVAFDVVARDGPGR